MALRRASAYSKKHFRPYTRRSSVKSQSYVKTIPAQKISNFKMGDINGWNAGKYKIIIRLVSGENSYVQMRDNAIEASRQSVHKVLEENFSGNYFFEVMVYPHQILRENKVLTGAGADRMQTGMAHSFGVTMGRAAIVRPNHEIFLIAVNSEKARQLVFLALNKIKAKLPCHTRTLLEVRKEELIVK